MKQRSSASVGTWCRILCKRQYISVGFWLVMALIPLMTWLIGAAATEESGFISVAVVAKSPQDDVSAAVMERLCQPHEMLAVQCCDSEEEAMQRLQAQQVQAVWVLQESFGDRLKAFADGQKEPLVAVYAAEESPTLRAAEEVLFSALYPSLSYAIYDGYADQTLDAVDPAHKQAVYDGVFRDESVIVFLQADGGSVATANYVTAPLRGLLLTVMLFGALTSALYYVRDERAGVWMRLSPLRRLGVCAVGTMCCTLTAAVFITLALILSGQYTSPLYETAVLLTAALGSSALASFLAMLTAKESRLAAITVVLLPTVLLSCPIFFQHTAPAVIGRCFPPYYALYAVADVRYAVYGFVYAIVLFVAAVAVKIARSKIIGGVRL